MHLALPEHERKVTLFGKMLRKFIKDDDIFIDTKRIVSMSYDLDLYKLFYEWNHRAGYILETGGLESRARRRADEIRDIFLTLKIRLPHGIYLDYGCSNGLITGAIGRRFNMREIWGTDLPSWNGVANNMADKVVQFREIVNGRIPVERLPKEVDLLSAIMVLHHIPPIMLDQTIQTLVDLVCPGGYLLLREHDAVSQEVNNLCHFEHAMYDLVMQDKPFFDFYNDYIANYMSITAWEGLFEARGLELLFTGKPFGATRCAWMLFQKPKKLSDSS
jgi:SAM-dependent methyltransferase